MDLPLELLELNLIEKELRKRNLLSRFYLEVGCGDGFNLERFSKIDMKGMAIDPSADAIEILRKKNLSGVEIIEGDFLKSDGVFTTPPEIIFMLNVLEHINDDSKFIEKAFSILPKGGVLIIAVPANQKAFGFADANAGHIRRYEKKDLKEKLINSGFTIDSWLSVGFPVNRTYTGLFNILNKNKLKKDSDEQTALSGIRNKENYYGGAFDLIAKILFPMLCQIIKIDGLFVKTNLGNNFVVFATKP